MVKSSGSSVTFHILDEECYKQAKAQGDDLAKPQEGSAENKEFKTAPKAKLCYLVNSKSGFGFSLSTAAGELQRHPTASGVGSDIHMLRLCTVYTFLIII